MPLEAKRVLGYDDLPVEYRPTDESNIRAAYPDLFFRLVACSGRNDKRAYWHARGLRPVRMGSGLVENEESYTTSADGTLRVGTSELWVERKELHEARVEEQRKKNTEQTRNLEMLLEEMEDEAGLNGNSFAARGSGPGIEFTGMGQEKKAAARSNRSVKPKPIISIPQPAQDSPATTGNTTAVDLLE